eukprot:Awhi_evm1s4716
MSCKLLLNLIESIFHKNDSENNGRKLLVHILETFTNKFAILKKNIPEILAAQARRQSLSVSGGNKTSTSISISTSTSTSTSTSISTSASTSL